MADTEATPDTPEGVRDNVTLPLFQHERDSLLLAIYDRMGRVEARVDAIPDHEDRIRKLEKRQWSVPGVSIIATLLAILGLHPHTS